jgi:hypothetical protein
MIALAVMSMTMVIMVSFLGGYARSLQHSITYNAALNRALDRRDFRGLLEAAHPRLFHGATESSALIGGMSSLQFLAFDAVTGDLVKVSLIADDTSGILAQVKGAGQFNEGQFRQLQLGPTDTSLSIEYFGGPINADQNGWSAEWTNDQVLPRLVRLTFSGETADVPFQSIWPGKTYHQREMSLSSLLPP